MGWVGYKTIFKGWCTGIETDAEFLAGNIDAEFLAGICCCYCYCCCCVVINLSWLGLCLYEDLILFLVCLSSANKSP